MQVQKKYLVAGAIGIVSLTAAFAYLQYKKIMNYAITLKSIKVKKVALNIIDFDIFLNFLNKSDLLFTIENQTYNIYINNVFVTKIENLNPVTIQKTSSSIIPLNISINPQQVLDKLGKNAINLLIEASKINLKVDVKLKVKLFGIKVSIPYLYETTLKQLMSSK